MSECTGATTFSNDEAHIWGSCGWTMPGTETKVFKVNPSDFNDKKECPFAQDIFNATEEEQGEICFRGRHIMKGYLANPDFGQEHVDEINAKNAGAIDDDGWLHSGDKGCISTKGMVKITGRYKEIIIGSGGENIAPVPIEDHVKSLCPAISNIMMIGEKKKYNTAFITLKAVGATGEAPGGDQLDGDAVLHGETTISGASANEAYIQMITDALIATNNEGKVCPSSASKIQKFSILPADFSVETNELTPTLKLKRSAVMKDPRYADILDRLYAPENKSNTYVPFNGVAEKTSE
jgi:long-chain-fatty-acid--CoA ligase ACSBG